MPIFIDPDGFVECAGRRWRCALGRGGIRVDKREGDGATPVGEFALGRVFYRPDKLREPPKSALTCTTLSPNWGWCDDPAHADYNRLITLPHPAHHERMWRDDDLYDLVVEILYNVDPVLAGHGSAIFLHVAKPDYSPTEGCIALKKQQLMELLRTLNENDRVVIPNPDRS